MTMYVWGYLNEYAEERADILDAVETVFTSGQLVWGPHTGRFERAFAEYHRVPHCVAVDNGTNAIVVALRALGIGPGDEVVTVSNTAAPTVLAINTVGAVPVFVDVDPDTYLMDVSQVPSVLTERTRCILPVHLYGQCVDMEPLERLAAEHDLVLLEDCAQAHGARQGGRLAGTVGHAGAFSFYPTKVLGAYGHAGGTITSDDEIADTMRRLRYYGMDVERYYVKQTPAHNARIDEVQAEILRRKLTRLDAYIAGRRAVAERYAEALADTDLVLPVTAPGNEHVYYVYVVRHPQRDRIIEKMKAYDIHLNISYPWPVHTMEGFAHLGYKSGDLPVTERLADEIFSLPMYPSLSVADQDRVVDALKSTLASL